jgi:hypothetical protein rflaF_11939
MNYEELKEKINEMSIPQEGFRFFSYDINNSYYGKDSNGYIAFAIESRNIKLKSFIQSTSNLTYFFNLNAQCFLEEEVCKKTIHILLCKNSNDENIDAFLRLTQAFAISNSNDYCFLTKLFSALTLLFSKETISQEKELQGLYAELFAILYFNEQNCDLAPFWQSKDKMKFDFSISENKRIEIKSTIKNNRIHRFKHEQLLSDLYDIKVISFMLQKNDYGYSLKDLVNDILIKFSYNLALVLHIENLIKNVDDSTLSSLKYDKTYTIQNIKVVNAEDIPHFYEQNPEGVANAEYDCDLTSINNISIEQLKHWINI